MNLPTGAGFYVWRTERCGGRDPEKFARDLHENNISWVAIKVCDGVNPPNLDVYWSLELLRPIIAACKRYGMQVWGWQYVYGKAPETEANVAADKCQALGLDGFIIDAEAEYKVSGEAAARRYIAQLRKRLGYSIPIGLSTYRYPSYHPDFPWAGFMGVDVWMPQVYWQGSQNSGYQLRKCYAEYMSLKHLPFIPAGATYHEWGWAATTASVKEFIDTCTTLSLPTFFFWELYDAQTMPGMLDIIRLTVPAPDEPPAPPPPPPPPEPVGLPYCVKVIATGLNYRSGPGMTYIVLGAYAQGTVLTIDQEQDGWGRVQGKDWWVNLYYTAKIDPPTYKAYSVRVTASALNYRLGPGVSYSVLGAYPQGMVLTIEDEKNGWGREQGKNWWISLYYTQRI